MTKKIMKKKKPTPKNPQKPNKHRRAMKGVSCQRKIKTLRLKSSKAKLINKK